MSDRDVKILKDKIAELTQRFDSTFIKSFESDVRNRAERGNIHFSYSMSGIDGYEHGDERFFERLSSYNLDIANEAELDMFINDLREIRKLIIDNHKQIVGIENPEAPENLTTISDISAQITERINNSPFMKNLPHEEIALRVKGITLQPDENIEDFVYRLEDEITQLSFEIDSARGMKVIGRHPELIDMYNDLLDMSEELAEEEKNRDTYRKEFTQYKNMCELYQGLEMIDAEIRNLRDNNLGKEQLERRRAALLKEYQKKPGCRTFFNKDGSVRGNQYILMNSLKDAIEDSAFRLNEMNGNVDKDVLQADVYTVEKVELLDSIENAYKITNADERKKKIQELSKSRDVELYAKRLEFKSLLEKLMKLIEEIKAKQARLDVLKSKPENTLTPAEKNEMKRLEKELDQSKDLQKNIRAEVEKLGKELRIDSIENGRLDLDDAKSIKTVGISDIDKRIKRQKEIAKEKRDKVCERYGADKTGSTDKIKTQVKERVVEIEKKKRVKPIEPDKPTNTSTKDSHDTAPETRHDSSTARGDTSANASLGSRYSEQDTKKKEKTKEPEFVSDDSIKSRMDELSYTKGRSLMSLEETDLQVQLNTMDPEYKQRIEGGIVYRYARGTNDGELLFVKENLEMYLSDPQGKLESVLDGLRVRMIRELGGEKNVEEFLQNNKSNKLLVDLLSKRTADRRKAKKAFIKALEDVNPGQENMAFASMAIALNSEIEPDEIVKTLSQRAQPYRRESDMKAYVIEKETKGFLGIGKKKGLEIDYKGIDAAAARKKRKDNFIKKNNSRLNVSTRSDGLIQPFAKTKDEMGGEQVKSKSPQRDRKDTKRKPRRTWDPGNKD